MRKAQNNIEDNIREEKAAHTHGRWTYALGEMRLSGFFTHGIAKY